MVHAQALATAAAASLFLMPLALAQGLYTKSSPVLQIDGKSYDNLIARSNHTTILEFYAPWCGHCKNLQPAYEKAATALSGLAKVAAVNCDEEVNKPFCGSMGVQGFPTLKIVRPGKKSGRPNVEDYQGQRTAKAIVDAVKDKIPNHVKRVTDKSLDEWLSDSKDTHKAILFSEKGTTSALLKALAIDYLGSINVAQIRGKEKAASERYGITTYPTLILLPSNSDAHQTYDGAMTKPEISTFLSTIASPNPDPAPKKPRSKKASSKDSPKSKASKSKASSSFASASKAHSSADASSSAATQTTETLDEASNPTASPNPNVAPEDPAHKPIQVPDVQATIPSLSTPGELQQACLTPKSGLCILALLSPDTPTSEAETESTKTIAALSDIHARLVRQSGGKKTFPIYALPASNTENTHLRTELNLDTPNNVKVLAVNAKKGWIKRYTSAETDREGLQAWIDAVKMGEGKKQSLPEGLVVEASAAGKKKSGSWSGQKEAQEPKVVVEQAEELSEEDVERLLKQAREKGGPYHGEL